jgi:Methyltransferase domain.
MSVLAPPRPPAAPSELDLPDISFFGRSLDEYVQFFSLDLAALRGASVLDVAAGPSSFTAEACRRGIDAVAVDPLYGASRETLGARVQRDYAAMFAQMRAKRRLFKLGRRAAAPVTRTNDRGRRASPEAAAIAKAIAMRAVGVPARSRAYFASIDEAESERRAAAQRFLADYETHYAHARYVCGSLPRLPFLDGAFDLVLCAHLLFTYAKRFDFAWHLAACRELVRVSAGEVRLHPVCGPDGRKYPELERLQAELGAAGITSKLVRVNYEFFVGSSSMLVLNPRAS